MPVTLHKIVLSTSELASLSEQARRFFVLACHVANELATLQKILLASMQQKPVSDVGTKGFAVQNLIIAKVLAGKLREARRALDRYYFTGVSLEFEKELDEDTKRALKDITTYFQKDDPITTVRNEAAFHYGADNVLKTLSQVPADHDLLLFAGEESGNSLYYAAEEIMTIALLEELPGGDAHAAFDKFVRDVQVIARAFTQFIEGFIYAAIMKAKPDINAEELVVDAADIAKLDDQTIRYFLEK